MSDAALRELRRREISPKAVADVCHRVLRTRPAVVSKLCQQGTFHRLFDVRLPYGRSFVVRVNILERDYPDHQMLVDAWIGRRLQGHGLSAPRVYHVEVADRRSPFDFEILERVWGTSLSEHDSDEPRMRSLLRQVGRALARVQRIPVAGYGYLDVAQLVVGGNGSLARGMFNSWAEYVLLKLPEHIARCRDIAAISAHEAVRIAALFSDLGGLLDNAESVLLHGDPGNHNFIEERGAITTILDWEDCMAGDPVFDVANWATFHPERRHQAFLGGYWEESSPPNDFELRFWLYYLRIALSKTVHRWRFGYVDRPGRQPAAQRIQTALKRLQSVA